MKYPIAFTISTLIVLSVAGIVFYVYGLPMLADTSVTCRYGPSAEVLGCSSTFGRFLKLLLTAVALTLVGIWNLFARD